MSSLKLTPTKKRLLFALFALSVWVSVYWLAKADAASTRYGAGAYDDSTGSYGYSYNHATQLEANAAALRQCSSAGCALKIQFYNACGAFAKDSSGGSAYGWGIADSIQGAQTRALTECRRRGGFCYVAVWGCTSR